MKKTIKQVLSMILIMTIVFLIMVFMFSFAYATTVPEFSLNISDERNEYVLVSVKLDKGAFKSIDLEVKTENTKKIGSCAYILSSDSFDAFNKKLQREGGSAVAVGYAATQKFGAAATSAFNMTGEDIAIFKFNKKSADKITNEDLTLIVTHCSNGNGDVVTAKAVNKLPEPTIPTYQEIFCYTKTSYSSYLSYDVKLGDALIIPETPTRSGYTFTGWYDFNTDKLVDLSKETMNSSYGRKFYAGWQANEYNSYFYVDGNLFTTVTNIYGERCITPRSPELYGYTFKGWNPKIPSVTPVGEMTFNAVFEPNTYIATLKVDGKVYKEISYTYGQKSISLPKVPEKAGYTGKWESYSLGVGGVTINAVYTKIIADVKSVNVSGTNINYKSNAKLSTEINASGNYKKTFTSSNSNIVMVDNEGNIYGAKKGSAIITCTITDDRGNSISDTCMVNVTYTWWQWIIKIVLFGWIWY